MKRIFLFIFLIIGLQVKPQSLLPSLVDYYNFEGNSNDATGRGHTGTNTGISFSTSYGKIGQGCYFNSTTSSIIVPNSSDFSFTNGTNDLPFTIETFINLQSTNTFYLFSKWNNGTYNEWQISYASGVMYFTCYSGSNYVGVQSTLSLSTNTWYHLVFTYNGSGVYTGFNIYKNGVSQTTSSYSSGTYTHMTATPQNMYIGLAGFSSSANAMNGYLDLTRFYKNYAATSSDVTYLYNGGAGRLLYPNSGNFFLMFN